MTSIWVGEAAWTMKSEVVAEWTNVAPVTEGEGALKTLTVFVWTWRGNAVFSASPDSR
jgi:hypothetical protein